MEDYTMLDEHTVWHWPWYNNLYLLGLLITGPVWFALFMLLLVVYLVWEIGKSIVRKCRAG